MFDSLEEFYETNKILPKRVIVYRDGVSESQVRGVIESEIKSFQRAFVEFKKKRVSNEEIKLVFICVNKKVNAKFFL